MSTSEDTLVDENFFKALLAPEPVRHQRRWEAQFSHAERRLKRVCAAYAALRNRNLKLHHELREMKARRAQAEEECSIYRAELRKYRLGALSSHKRLLGVIQHAVVCLHEAGDDTSAERIQQWADVIRDDMTPLARVSTLTWLLDCWLAAEPWTDPDEISELATRTRYYLEILRGERDASTMFSM